MAKHRSCTQIHNQCNMVYFKEANQPVSHPVTRFLSLDFWTVIIKCDVILPYFKLLLLSIPLPKYEEWVVMNGCLPITLNQSGHSTLTCGTNKAFSLFWDSVNLIDCLG